ncbi:unnamed protein product [Darwinula stevensoni]|uniref:Oplophorus-luciferin 2-monooxygenase non-catalytic subunit n=1 Tax=Darwinula stevensoni TaxID=69355 RepID=A0A7R8X5U0_9CRUS|nr:unnamed protein product [Darwinula stevensoni]CAG0886998.1 unnamed protein product [Darwinula stevensoni]
MEGPRQSTSITSRTKMLPSIASLCLLACLLRGTRGQNPCPGAADIAPCTCEQVAGEVTVDCSDVATADELFNVFNNIAWPNNELTEFRLTNNDGVLDLPEGVFGEVSFQRLYVSGTSVANLYPLSILPHLAARLEELRIMDSSLTDFPFVILSPLRSLKVLDISGNAISAVPALQSSSLQIFNVEFNQITALEEGWSTPNLKELHVGANPIQDIPAGLFGDFAGLEEFSCSSCALLGPTLRAGLLQFHSEALIKVDLRISDLTGLEDGAFTGLTNGTVINLQLNDMTDLPEASV